MSLNKWVTSIVEGQSVDSVSKARGDVATVAESIGYNKLYIYRYFDEREDERALTARIDGITAGVAKGDLIVYQYPSYNQFQFEQTFVDRVKQRGARLVLLIHDSELLRDNSFLKEIHLFNKADMLITHGEKMENKLRSFGILTPMIKKELFDYLVNEHQILFTSSLNRSLVFAGNLQKSVFLKDWRYQTGIDAFGLKGDIPLGETVNYKGVYSQPELLRRIPKDRFGIAWDNDLFQGGNYQEYTKYNSPHKVSLYLALGLPVIVWQDSAIADFVVKYRLGFAISSLSEIDPLMAGIEEDELKQLKQRVNRFGCLLREGLFTKQVLIQVEHDILLKEME